MKEQAELFKGPEVDAYGAIVVELCQHISAHACGSGDVNESDPPLAHESRKMATDHGMLKAALYPHAR